MSAKDLVLDFLRKEGFLPEVAENGNVVFKYQMTTFVFFVDENDEGFFQLAMPHIYDVTEDNRELVLEAANRVNQSLKVMKACVVDNSVWLMFEILLDATPDVKDIMPRALSILMGSRQAFYQELD